MKNSDRFISNWPDPVVVPERLENETEKSQAEDRLQRPRPTNAVMHLTHVVHAANCDDTLSPRGYIAVEDVLRACRTSDVVATIEFDVNPPVLTSKIAAQARNAALGEVINLLYSADHDAKSQTHLLNQLVSKVEAMRVI